MYNLKSPYFSASTSITTGQDVSPGPLKNRRHDSCMAAFVMTMCACAEAFNIRQSRGRVPSSWLTHKTKYEADNVFVATLLKVHIVNPLIREFVILEATEVT